ncbi:TIR domain-containing protein [Veronia pacifica]|uniref:Thoeris protein ThsB TIR-like domain-containing protein n=1 Tax=Veronia pacifica TaxID=1080227 RepID=A0A1C3EPH0_9GAMM|nr:TIR domain-containing protein [Veronia pacifica]ODA35109.1 hypothetical protein A8L45_05375 [Veronia pacifica]
MKSIFVSYAPEDCGYYQDLRSIFGAQSSPFLLLDGSLSEKLRDKDGKIVTELPYDPLSHKVSEHIQYQMSHSVLMLVLVSNIALESKWSEWEIRQFIDLHGLSKIIFVCLQEDNHKQVKKRFSSANIIHWNKEQLYEDICHFRF